jgi:AraC-like DNA-binding protein
MTSEQARPWPVAVSVETSDLDEAREVCGEHLYPRSMRPADRSARLAGRFTFLHLGRLTLADVRYGAEMTGRTGELGSYHVNLPLAGTFAAGQGGREITGDPGRAGVYRPVGENVLHRSSADCHLLALKVEPASLEDQLGLLLDAPVRESLRLDGELDVRGQPGHTFASLVRLLGAEIENPTGLVHDPIVGAPLEEALLLALLYAAGHQYRDALTGRQVAAGDRHVDRVIEAIHADPRQPYTLAGLARLAGVSPGALRRAFHRKVGLSPMAYLREVRMIRAHADLRAADPERTSVADIARRWGYARPDRFATRYRERYHTDADETLRGPRFGR